MTEEEVSNYGRSNTTSGGLPPGFEDFTMDQLRQYAINASSTIESLQSGPGAGDTVVPGSVNSAAERLKASQAATPQNPRPNIEDTTPVASLRADGVLSSLADQLIQQVSERAPWLVRPTAQQGNPFAGSFTGAGLQPPGQPFQGMFPPGGQVPVAGQQQLPAGAGAHHQPTNATGGATGQGQGGQHVPGSMGGPQAPGGPSLFSQMWTPNLGSNTNVNFRSDKEYREYLVRNYLSNDMSAYANLALGRKDITNCNVNMPAFCLGQIHFLLQALQNNMIASPNELMARLFHFKNILEITTINCPLSEFNSRAWQIAREYDNKVVRNMDQGLLSWSTLGPMLQYDCHIHAVSTVGSHSANNRNTNSGNAPTTAAKQICNDYNLKQNEGNHCTWSAANPGKKCSKAHACRYCVNKDGKYRTHREFDCESKARQSGEFTQTPFLGAPLGGTEG